MATSTPDAPDGLVFEDPPGEQPRRGNLTGAVGWIERLRPLTNHPGKWAKVATYTGIKSAGQTASQINNHKIKLPLGRWAATWRYIDADGNVVDHRDKAEGSALWVMYQGERAVA